MRPALAIGLLLCAVGGLAGCGEQEEPAALPPTGTAYRALDDADRLAVAERCRDDAVAAAGELAAAQLEDVDAKVLADELDSAFRMRREQPRPVAAVCRERLPFVTPGLRLSFRDAKEGGGVFAYETESDRPLYIRGKVSPPPGGGGVTVRREFGGSRATRGGIGRDGSFALQAIKLRKIADNSFVVTIDAPPNALRKVRFSAICLDCLAGGPPPPTTAAD